MSDPAITAGRLPGSPHLTVPSPTSRYPAGASRASADDFDGRLAVGAADPLKAFNQSLVLTSADVHVAVRLGQLTGETDPTVLLAAALAARAPRLGHVCVDLATVAATTMSDIDETVDVRTLPWPEVDVWLLRVAGSPLVGDDVSGADDDASQRRPPLRLVGTRLYLDRYWRHQQAVAADIEGRNTAAVVDMDELTAGLDRLFDATRAVDGGPDLQRLGAAVAVLRRFAVIAGGPGTGKTTTVARVVALLDEQARACGAPPPKIALAAPTGKAAARLQEGVHAEAAHLAVDAATRARLLDLRASTVHRLLGSRPDSQSRFRHDRHNHLSYDTVIIDETSMVALSMMARLMEALRPDARLVLLGDPDQLSSVEAGAVLGDIVGPAADRFIMSGPARLAAGQASGQTIPDAVRPGEPAPGPGLGGADGRRPGATAPTIGDGIVVLRQVHRFRGGIAEVAAAIRRGDADATVAALRAAPASVTWHEHDDGVLGSLQAAWVDAGRAVLEAARAGDGRGALAALGTVRILCAHRRGADGVAVWMARAEGWLADAIPGYGTGGRWYTGRPVLVTRNDYSLSLSNGDVGVIVTAESGLPTAAFERGGEVVAVAPTRLEAVETVHAMTIHKSQGSQFATVAVVVPDADSRVMTRELLYTAITRARSHVHIIGDEARVRAGVNREVARASGLRARLWGE
jgi:exodeoxyribonuclease V alpha subunit